MYRIIKDIDLKKNYDSGQLFNWYDVGKSYIMPLNDSLFSLEQIEKNKAKVELIKGRFEDLGDYFDEQTNYSELYSKIANNFPELAKASKESSGIRLLKQNDFEMIITFMFSANNNIPRIKKSIDLLRQQLGKKITEYNGITYYSFPKVDDLLNFTEENFKNIGAGYRAKYLTHTVRNLYLTPDFDSWHNLNSKDLIIKLKTLKGIGVKVAHCVALFGYHRRDVFPVDTWVKKALKQYYDVENLSEKKIEENFLNKFGNDSALVQQIMFYYQKTQN